uniref:Non-structural protein 7b n=1 Tax=Ferret coronavirus TaxID=1264898 RepID=A0A224AW06_9ALPC|nr:non-structural protein [Ferret coronavirus]
MLTLGLLVLFLFSNSLGQEDDKHQHPTYNWERLDHFEGSYIEIDKSVVLSLPLDAKLHCGLVDGVLCKFPGFESAYDDHVDYYLDVDSPFYKFVDTFYVAKFTDGKFDNRATLKFLPRTSKDKMLVIGCSLNDPLLDLPFGTQIYNDVDMTLKVDHVPCTNRRYFIKYCPGGPNHFCFKDKLVVRRFRAFFPVSNNNKIEHVDL